MRLAVSGPWHPTLLAVSFVAANLQQTGLHAAAAGRALLVAIIASLTLRWACALLLRHREGGAVVATGAVAVIVFWIPILAVQTAATLAGPPVIVTITIAFVSAVFVVVRLLRRRGHNLLLSVSTSLSVLTASLAVVVGAGYIFGPMGSSLIRDARGPDAALERRTAARGYPDIVVILMDGHPRADSAREIAGHDMSHFLDRLTASGLKVASMAAANYDWTGATLASMLNMRLLDDVPARGPSGAASSPAFLSLRTLIDENEAFDVLRSSGYEIVAIGPPYEHVALRSADRFVDVGYLNTFECHLLRRTAIGAVLWAVAPGFFGDAHRGGVLRSLAEAERAVSGHEGPPRFVLVHLPVPHPPVLWDNDGRPVEDAGGSDCAPPGAAALDHQGQRDAFLESLAYADTLVADSVETMVAASETDPVVIVLSDHGARFRDPVGGYDRAWRNAFGVLFAARTPGFRDLFPDDVRLVNVLPRLFSAYLGLDLSLSPGTSFWESGRVAPRPH